MAVYNILFFRRYLPHLERKRLLGGIVPRKRGQPGLVHRLVHQHLQASTEVEHTIRLELEVNDSYNTWCLTCRQLHCGPTWYLQHHIAPPVIIIWTQANADQWLFRDVNVRCRSSITRRQSGVAFIQSFFYFVPSTSGGSSLIAQGSGWWPC